MTLMQFCEVAIRALVVAVMLLTAFGYMTLIERRVLARFQRRLGPNRVGPLGLLQPLADGLKLLFKEQLIPREARTFIFLLAPCLSLVVSLSCYAFIPVAMEAFPITESYSIKPVITDINIGILFLLGISSISVYGIVLGGWASGNKYSLIGGIRSSAQMISYELALGSSLVAPLIMVGSLSFMDVVSFQKEFTWIIFQQPLAFVIFWIAMIAETNRAPFDLPEAEQELGAGFHTEYSGMRFALYFMAEYVAMITMSSVITCVFLGGSLAPWYFEAESLLGRALNEGPWWFILKVAFFMFVFIWLRATLPRYRYDQLMRIGWQVLLPLSVLNIVITCIGVVFSWPWWGYTLAIVGTVTVLYAASKSYRIQQGESHG